MIGSTLIAQLSPQRTVQERQEAIDRACRDGTGDALAGRSLSGCDLSGLQLTDLDLHNVDFRDSTCRGASFPELIGCTFDGVDVARSSLPRLERCLFRRARLTGAQLGGRIAHCDFSNAEARSVMIGAVLPHRAGEYHDNTFRDADLHGLDAAGGYLAHTSFHGADLTGARLSRADLTSCDFGNTRLAGANLAKSVLTGAAFPNADVGGCLVTCQEREQIQRARPSAQGPRVVSFAPGPAVHAAEREAESAPEWRVDWQFHRETEAKVENTMLWRADGLRASSFHEDGGFIRMYPLGGTASLRSILLDMAADYAGWAARASSVAVRLCPDAAAVALTRAFRDALTELFQINPDGEVAPTTNGG